MGARCDAPTAKTNVLTSHSLFAASNHFVKQALEFEKKYKTDGYNGDVVPDSWDDYILTEDAELFADFNEGVMGDIVEDDDGVEDGFAEADIGE